MYNAIEPVLSEFLTALILAVLTYVSFWIKKWLVIKMGREQYNAAAEMAYGIWIELQEHVPALIGEDKMNRMKEILHIEFPLLSDAQLTAINKECHRRALYLFDPVVPKEE